MEHWSNYTVVTNTGHSIVTPPPKNNPIYHYTVRIAKPKPELFQEQVRLMTTNSYENTAFEVVSFKQKSVSCNITRVKRKRIWWSSSKDRDLPYAVINHIVRTWREMCENLTCPWMHLLLTGKFPENRLLNGSSSELRHKSWIIRSVKYCLKKQQPKKELVAYTFQFVWYKIFVYPHPKKGRSIDKHAR